MTESTPPIPLGNSETLTVANFINKSGEVIQQRLGTMLPLPSIGEHVSFGQIQTEDSDKSQAKSGYYNMGNVHVVRDVEYNYAEIVGEDDEMMSQCVSVLIHVESVETG